MKVAFYLTNERRVCFIRILSISGTVFVDQLVTLLPDTIERALPKTLPVGEHYTATIKEYYYECSVDGHISSTKYLDHYEVKSIKPMSLKVNLKNN